MLCSSDRFLCITIIASFWVDLSHNHFWETLWLKTASDCPHIRWAWAPLQVQNESDPPSLREGIPGPRRTPLSKSLRQWLSYICIRCSTRDFNSGYHTVDIENIACTWQSLAIPFSPNMLNLRASLLVGLALTRKANLGQSKWTLAMVTSHGIVNWKMEVLKRLSNCSSRPCFPNWSLTSWPTCLQLHRPFEGSLHYQPLAAGPLCCHRPSSEATGGQEVCWRKPSSPASACWPTPHSSEACAPGMGGIFSNPKTALEVFKYVGGTLKKLNPGTVMSTKHRSRHTWMCMRAFLMWGNTMCDTSGSYFCTNFQTSDGQIAKLQRTFLSFLATCGSMTT